jgi:hypothetical protein
MATRENATFFSPVAPRLNVEAWSPDGKLVAGSILDGTGSPRQPVVREIATGLVRTLDVPPPLNEFSFAVAGWLPDSRRFLFASGTGIVVRGNAIERRGRTGDVLASRRSARADLYTISMVQLACRRPQGQLLRRDRQSAHNRRGAPGSGAVSGRAGPEGASSARLDA